MPRTGLSSEQIVETAASLADEIGFATLTMGVVAERLDMRPPSLYKHVLSLDDLQHRIATLAMVELGEQVRDALQGKAGRDALAALLRVVRRYVTEHPGRYAATIGEPFRGEDDPFLHAAARLLGSLEAVLGGYGISTADTDHAARTLRCLLHGFAALLVADAFQWDADIDRTFEWMTSFADLGLRAISSE